MQLICQLPQKADRATAVAIGNFDGMHLGHQAVIAAMADAARANHSVPSVLTFEPHPRRFFAPTSPAFRLERLRTKLARLSDAGVVRVYMPRFNKAFSGLSPDAFLNDILGMRLGAKAVITGENFAFGKDRGGDIRTLRAWGEKNEVAVIAVPPVRFGEAICSSSAIRAELAAGDVVGASHLLGRAYSLSGRVVHGEGKGKGLGFPTANVSLPPTLKLPAYGIYAVRVQIDGERFDGVASLGVKPTMGVYNQPTLEIYVFDLQRDLYGKTLVLTFVDYLRPEKKFESLAPMIEQMHKDCEQAKEILRGSTL